MELELDDYEWEELRAEAVFKKALSSLLAVGMGTIVEDQIAYAVLMASYYLPGNIEMHGYVRHDRKGILKLNKLLPLVNIANRPIVLDLESRLGYREHFDWVFELELDHQYNERVSFRLNFQADDRGDKSSSLGVKISF